MGHKFTWFATKDLAIDELCVRLDLLPIRDEASIPNTHTIAQDVYGPTAYVLENGCSIVLMEYVQEVETPERTSLLPTLSQGITLLAYEQLDSLNVSATSEWHHGEEVWAVVRNPDMPEEDQFMTRGSLPIWYQELRDAVYANEDDYDTLGDLTRFCLLYTSPSPRD